MKKLLFNLLRLGINLLYLPFYLFKVNKKKITFLSRQENDTTLDFNLLKDEILKQDSSIKIVFMCKRFDNIKKHLLAYSWFTIKTLYHVRTSHVCIVDSYSVISMLPKSKNRKVLQLWHALGAIKKFGYQTLDKEAGRDKDMAKSLCMHKGYDLILSPSDTTTTYFMEAFNYPKSTFFKCGLPRIDYLKENEKKLKKDILKKYPEFKEKKVILYAPTFRKNKKDGLKELIKNLDLKKYHLIVKGHENQKLTFKNKKVYSCSEFKAMDLLSIADYVITDYSAIALEAMILKKKIFYYLYDYYEYTKENGLNVNLLEELPKTTFKKASDLANSLSKNYPWQEYEAYYQKYLTYTENNTKKIASKVVRWSRDTDEKIKVIIINIAKKHPAFRKVVRFLSQKYNSFKYSFYYHKYKVDDHVILFESFMGRTYTCSPKAIFEKMCTLKEFENYTFIWAFKDPKEKKPFFNSRRVKLVKYKSKEYYKYCSVAKYWITNSLMDISIKKKENQVYIQTWHGTPLKRLRCDIKVNGSVLNTKDEIVKRNNLDVKRIDYFLSPSPYATKCFTSAFNLKNLKHENIIVEKGYPRNDFLYNYTEEDIERIKKSLGIKTNKKIILYAPTFRDNEHKSGLGYTYSLNLNFKKFKHKFGKDYIILFRTHYFISNAFDFSKYKGFIYNVSDYDDVNDLYVISDLLITDYSSVFFDFANLSRPMIFYMYDLDLYKNNLRDFYMSLDELPGPIVQSEDDLFKVLKNMNLYWQDYQDKYDKFKEKFNPLDGPNTSLEVIDEILYRESKKPNE